MPEGGDGQESRNMVAGSAAAAPPGATALSKISWRLLPLIGLGYGIAFMDRINISFAAQRMNADLHFSATIYGLGGGLFFLSYALFEIPSNLLLVRFGASKWIARIMLTWGVLAICMMFVRTPLEFCVLRFLLGLAEAGFFPGALYYLTTWFPSAYMGRAISRFYVAWPLSNMVMGAIAGMLLGLQGRLGLTGWQWLFLIEGLPAVVMSAVILFFLPDTPASVRWLTEVEKSWLEQRMISDLTRPSRRQDQSIWKALLNPMVFAFTAVNFISLGCNYAFGLSAPVLLSGATHLDATKVGFIVAAGGALGAAAMIFNGWHSDRHGERYLHLAFPLALSALAFTVLSLTTSAVPVVGAYWLAMCATAAWGAVFWLAPCETISRNAMAVSVAAINSIGISGGFVGPLLWGMARDATGSFRAGLMTLAAAFLCAVALSLLMRHSARQTSVLHQPGAPSAAV
jgi:ACS family tartrate transporter-like MFS transporter